jgi:hypothetical protein
VLSLAAAGAAHGQGSFSLEQLFALLGAQPRLNATFTEQKFIKGVDGAIESSGELLFETPARMVKRTVKPVAETLVLDGSQAVVERGPHRRSVALEDHPEIAVHVEGLRACLAGDLPALLRLYRASLSGTAAQWKLTLVPRDSQAAAQVLAIDLGGEQGQIRSVQVLMANGDRALTRITPAATGR